MKIFASVEQLRQTWLWRIIKLLIRLRFPGVPHLSTKKLATWLEQDQKPLLLDARTEREYNLSHLGDAQIVSYSLKNLSEQKPLNLQTPIVAYCSVGYRSARLAQQLQNQGYEKVFNLEGSIFAWANEGYPVYRDKQLVKEVHPYNRLWGHLLKPDLHPDNWQSVD